MSINYVTQEVLMRMKEELNALKTTGRSQIAHAISEAREKGDLKENAEYDAAKEAQGMLEMRISKLQDIIANSKILHLEEVDTSKVSILTTVSFINKSNNAKMFYTLVPESETDLKKNKISVNTPIAKGLLGKKVGEEVTITLPNGNVLNLEITDISI